MINGRLRPLLLHPNPVTLYHGSPDIIPKFQITDKSRSRTDFGLGVYFTTNREQAKEWSIRGAGVKHGYVYEVKFDLRTIKSGTVRLKSFLDYNEEFIETFTYCRAFGTNPDNIKGYDMIYGLMLDSGGYTIQEICDGYTLGKYTMQQVKSKLMTFENKDQICIKSQDILDNLKIERVYETYLLGSYTKSRKENIRWKK